MPSHIEAPSKFSSSVVSIGTNLLFLGLEPHGIISYNVENGQLLIPRPLNSSNLAFIECNGPMLLTSVVRNTNSSTILILNICECLCNKNVIVILLRTNRMSRLYTYDVMGREWSKVPKLTLPKKRYVSIISGIDFFPSFAMP
ncbi:hypothetical protein V2J09_021616 [Rumex salicifolius]